MNKLLLAFTAIVALTACGTAPKGFDKEGNPVSGYVCGSWPVVAPAMAGDVLKESCDEVPRSDFGGRSVIVFIHGLSGDSIGTWLSETGGIGIREYWPALARMDKMLGSKVDVYVYGYKTGFLGNQPFLFDTMNAMAANLANAGVFEHEYIYIVAHSMGGILARSLVLEHPRNARKIRSIHYFGTPGEGSPIASLVAGIPFTSNQIKALTSADVDSGLAVYGRYWDTVAALPETTKVALACTCETRPITIAGSDPGLLVVSMASCRSMCKKALDIDVTNAPDRDHFNLVKPYDTLDPIYANFRQVHGRHTPTVGGWESDKNDLKDRGAACPRPKREYDLDLSRPFEFSVSLYPHDVVVVSDQFVPVVPDPNGSHGPLPRLRSKVEGIECPPDIDTATGAYFRPAEKDGDSAPVPIRFRQRDGKVRVTVYPYFYPQVERALEPAQPTTIEDDTVVSPTPWNPCQSSRRAGDTAIRCTTYGTDTAFIALDRDDPPPVGSFWSSNVDALIKVISDEGAPYAVIRGFASNEPMNCAAWTHAVWKLELPESVRGWECKDNDPNANANTLLSRARAEVVRDKLERAHINASAVGCGTRFAKSSAPIGAPRGVSVELRRTAPLNDEDLLLGCLSASVRRYHP